MSTDLGLGTALADRAVKALRKPDVPESDTAQKSPGFLRSFFTRCLEKLLSLGGIRQIVAEMVERKLAAMSSNVSNASRSLLVESAGRPLDIPLPISDADLRRMAKSVMQTVSSAIQSWGLTGVSLRTPIGDVSVEALIQQAVSRPALRQWETQRRMDLPSLLDPALTHVKRCQQHQSAESNSYLGIRDSVFGSIVTEMIAASVLADRDLPPTAQVPDADGNIRHIVSIVAGRVLEIPLDGIDVALLDNSKGEYEFVCRLTESTLRGSGVGMPVIASPASN